MSRPFDHVVNVSLPPDLVHEPIFDITPARHSPGPGMIRPAHAIAVWIAMISTLLLFALTSELWRRHLYPDGSRSTLTFFFQLPSLLLVPWLLWRHRVKRDLCLSLRVCACIPLLHVALLVGVQAIWSYSSIDDAWWNLQLAQQIPSWTILAVAAALLTGVLIGPAVRRVEARISTWLWPLTIFAVTFLLILGLWLPLACKYSVAFEEWHWFVGGAKILRTHFLWIVLLPPALLAPCIAMLPSTRWMERASSYPTLRATCVVMLVIVTLAGIDARASASADQILAYANVLPIMLLAAALSIMCISTLALAHWQSLRLLRRSSPRPAPFHQKGIVLASADSRPPGLVRYRGWLGGIETETSSFILQTHEGNIAIPRGAHLIAPIPLWTTAAPRGAWRAALRLGDRVEASGFVNATGDNPYRSSAIPIVGSEGIAVWKESQRWSVWQEVTLATWRPTLLYLAASGIVALPGLAGFFAL